MFGWSPGPKEAGGALAQVCAPGIPDWLRWQNLPEPKMKPIGPFGSDRAYSRPVCVTELEDNPCFRLPCNRVQSSRPSKGN